jgi:neutral ceramidase
VGYANEYAGYVTTREEYATQQYEGGHTLYGPWTLAAYQQELTRLAKVLEGEADADSNGPTPIDFRDEVASTALGSGADVPPADSAYGVIKQNANSTYSPGDAVEVVVWSGDPSNDFAPTKQYFVVQRRTDSDTFETAATDGDWSTTSRWARTDEGEGPMQMTATWTIPVDTEAGDYRIIVWGISTDAAGESSAFEVVSDTFNVD